MQQGVPGQRPGIALIRAGMESAHIHCIRAIGEPHVVRLRPKVKDGPRKCLFRQLEADIGIDSEAAFERIWFQCRNLTGGIGKIAPPAECGTHRRFSGQVGYAPFQPHLRAKSRSIELRYIHIRLGRITAVEEQMSLQPDLIDCVSFAVGEGIGNLAVGNIEVNLDRRQIDRSESIRGGETCARIQLDIGIEAFEHRIIILRQPFHQVAQSKPVQGAREPVEPRLAGNIHIHRHPALHGTKVHLIIRGGNSERLEAETHVTVKLHREVSQQVQTTAGHRHLAAETQSILIAPTARFERGP